MTKAYEKDKNVTWKWGQGHTTGTVVKSSFKKMQKTIKGSKISKNGTNDNPAYLIKQENGQHVLKLHSELDT